MVNRNSPTGLVGFYTAATDSFSTAKPVGFVPSLAVDGTGSKMLTATDSLVLDRDLVLRATIPGPGTSAVALNSAGSLGYRLRNTDVEVVDTVRALVVGVIPLPEQVKPVGGDMALTPDNESLVVLTGSGFSVVPVADPIPTPCTTPSAPISVVAVCGGPLADVVTDRGHAYASNPTRNQVEVVSQATRTLEASIPVGSQPKSLDLSPDGQHPLRCQLGCGGDLAGR
ncbi:MAG: YncE family protein, partial [Acidimicrobiales bacterium]